MPLGVVGGVTFAILAHFDVPSTLWLVVAVGFAFSWPLLDIKDRQVVRPRFQLVAPGATESKPREPGLTVRLRAAIRRRPVLSLVLTSGFGILVNKVSDKL